MPASHSCGCILLFDGVNIFSMSKQAVLSMCGHLNNGPKMSTTLIPRICECVTLYGKRNFADMISSRDLEMGDHPGLPWIISEAQSNHMVLKRRKLTSFGQRKRDVTIEKSQTQWRWPWRRRKGQKPRIWWPPETGKGKKHFLPLSLWRNQPR